MAAVPPRTVLVVCSDTHGTDGPRLAGRTAAAVRAAGAVVHAGDFTTAASLDGFHAAAARLHAVHGNADEGAVRDRLPDARTVAWRGLRVAVTHRHDAGATGLAMVGRSRGADLVVFGHSHRPTVRQGDPVLVNPGSHADPRGGRPTHVELAVAGDDPFALDGGDPDATGSAPDPEDHSAGRPADGSPPGDVGYIGRVVARDGDELERFRIDARE